MEEPRASQEHDATPEGRHRGNGIADGSGAAIGVEDRTRTERVAVRAVIDIHAASVRFDEPRAQLAEMVADGGFRQSQGRWRGRRCSPPRPAN